MFCHAVRRVPRTSRVFSPAACRWASGNAAEPPAEPTAKGPKLPSKPTSLTPASAPKSVAKRPVIVAKAIRHVAPDPEEREYHATVVNGRGSLEPYRHPQTHGIPVASLHLRSHFPPLLALFSHFAMHAAASLGIPVSGVAMLPTQRTLWTVPRGPFVHKKSQENFERRVHKRAIKAFDADSEVVDRWVKYLERHALAGVGIRVVRWHRVPVGVGKLQLESVVGQMRLGVVSDKQKVQELGKKIIAEEMKGVDTAPSVL
ncbi:ribosomal protein S10 [Artomyces pyxidatus]|uniref:Ribosomal protein S10 n=1 Tax=Artomyces pyxidatus TaxID=48021 RepID=A0ACB8TGG6_9AGAM|nr:ribosomal protein S10 [Artomyces pyxidatus]